MSASVDRLTPNNIQYLAEKWLDGRAHHKSRARGVRYLIYVATLDSLQDEIRDLKALVQLLAARLPTIVTVPEAARVFGVSTRTVRRRIKDREWPSIHVGDQVRIDLSKVRP